MTKHKAYVAAGIAVLTAFVGSLVQATVGDGATAQITANEWLVAVSAALASAGLAFGGTYVVSNQAKAPSFEPGTYGDGSDLDFGDSDDTYL